MKRASLHIEETPPLFVNNTIYSPLHSERVGGEASLNTEYIDGTKLEGDTEFLKEHGNPQRQTPLYNSKCKIHNSKL